MGVSKVILNGSTLIDVTDDTVASSNLLTGYTATGADGETVLGAITNGSATTPTTSITANPTISVNSSTGVITASASASQSITPTVVSGYVTSGTAGAVSVSGSATEQLSVQAAQTITPTTTDQTIAAGKYTTGTQTIKGDSNLVASNIIEGVTIFNVSGTGRTVPELQNKTVTPTSSTQSITHDSGYEGLGTVTVNPIPVEVVGTKLIIPSGVIGV